MYDTIKLAWNDFNDITLLGITAEQFVWFYSFTMRQGVIYEVLHQYYQLMFSSHSVTTNQISVYQWF